MKKPGVFQQILDCGIIPIIRTNSSARTASVAAALIKGTVSVLEISLSVPASLGILETTADAFGNKLLLGAGTVLDPATARSAIAAGARFIVSPTTNAKVIDVCKRLSVPVFPGALTPTEIVNAFREGADAVKVFPCNAMGGPDYIRSILAPLPDAVLFPCGGVGIGNAGAYLNAGAAALFVGSSLLNTGALKSGKYGTVTTYARRLSVAIRSYRKKSV
jgi:2-dehydro-3-deoxyphosphogluconate aldolase / (4S)-4-hydroxy-2-oxoglutarate aldolase